MRKRVLRMRNLFLALIFFQICTINAIAQQLTEIRGVVTDMAGEPLIGVSVVQEKTTLGTVTDINGEFMLKAQTGKTLVFSYVGFINEEVTIKNQSSLTVIMKEDTKSLDEVIVVGYGSTTRRTVTGAVSTLKNEDIMKAPVANVSGALAGRVPGLITKQSGGQPGSDDTSLRIRGVGTFASGGILVLVDGIERSFQTLDPEEIESLTVLKDAASTAVYGIRGADGVLLVTTKRGKMGEPKISLTTNYALQNPTRMPKSVNSYDYARLYNEAIWNDNPIADQYYKDEVLEKYRTHSDPLFYPDADWIKLATNKYSEQQKHNLNISGGSEFARYFVSLGYLSQNGMQKEMNKAYDYSNRDSYNRLNMRSNIDMTVTKSTTVGLTVGLIRGHKTRQPDETLQNIFRFISLTPPNVSPGMWDGKYIMLEGALTERNPMYELTRGVSDIYENHMDATIEIKQNLDFILPGLNLKLKAAFDNDYNYKNTRTKTDQLFYPKKVEINGKEEVVYYSKTDPAELADPSMAYSYRNKRYYGDVSLTYENSFKKHNVAALVLFNANKTYYSVSQYSSVPTGYLEYVGRVSYDYDRKYLLEFNMGINGSENFPQTQRYGYFPAVSAGWVLSNEDFFKQIPATNFISFLKLRASYGEVGNDKLGSSRFLYFPSRYTGIGAATDRTFTFGESPVTEKGYTESAPGTPQITWERARKENYAIDLKFLKDKLFVTAEYFKDKRDNILTTMNTIPFLTGISSGAYNIGKTENHGFEIETGWAHAVGGFNYYIRGNYSFARNKIVEMDEAFNLENPHLWRTGRRIGEIFGYVQEGFFQSQEEIDAWPSQFGVTLSPGDVKYRDVNGDGVVNTYDQVPLRHPNFPEISYGISGGFSYKKFDMSFLFQGTGNASLTLSGQYQKPFSSLGTIYEHQRDKSWRQEAMASAEYPRLSASHSQEQNYYNSTIWVKDASYLRFKNLEFGYTFSANRLLNKKQTNIRVYFSAQNLWVWDKLDGIIDPENKAAEIINYPQQRIFNVGMNVKF